jgi:hypothetical protein
MVSLSQRSVPLLILLLLISPLNSSAQNLKGSFGKTSHFYKMCSSTTKEVDLESTQAAWRGERISKVIVLWTEGDPVEEIRFSCTDFTCKNGSQIDSELLQIRSIKYVKADQESRPCGEFGKRDPDQLHELGDVLHTTLETSLQPECSNIYWLSMDIPQELSPGIYKGQILVSAGHSTPLEFRLSLEVSGLKLPAVSQWGFHLDLWQFPTAVVDSYNDAHPGQGMEYWSDAHFSLLKQNYLLLANTGQKVITAHIKEGALGSPSMIRWVKHRDQSWTYEFTHFDRYVDSMMSWGIRKQINCQSPVGWNSDVIPYWCEEANSAKELTAPLGSETYRERWDHFLHAFQKHLKEKGWFDKTVLYLDEVELEKLSWILKVIKSNNPHWKIGLAGFTTLPEAITNQIYDLSMMVGRDSIPHPVPDKAVRTFYTSCNPPRPNNFLVGDADPAENIWMAWHAQAMGYTGFLRWAYDYWTHADPTEQRIGGHSSGDFSLSYRSSNELNMQSFSSVRLELVREGIEDYEKIRYLKEILSVAATNEDRTNQAHLFEMLQRFRWKNTLPGNAHQLVSEARDLLDEITIHYSPPSNTNPPFPNHPK